MSVNLTENALEENHQYPFTDFFLQCKYIEHFIENILWWPKSLEHYYFQQLNMVLSQVFCTAVVCQIRYQSVWMRWRNRTNWERLHPEELCQHLQDASRNLLQSYNTVKSVTHLCKNAVQKDAVRNNLSNILVTTVVLKFRRQYFIIGRE